MIPYKQYKLQGFTLLELSIVLVIIALIISSVVITQSMIRDAQIRGVISELTRYTQAIKDFQDKYRALPGDFSGAETLWGTVAGGCPLGSGSGTQTCNGDGDGRIGDQTTANKANEEFRAWQHLADANMVEATVTGIADVTSWHWRIPGTNIPKSQLEGAGWGLTCVTVHDISSAVVQNQVPYVGNGDLPPNHVLWLGGASIYSTTNLQAPVLKVEEAESIDTKIDDGAPNLGKIVAQNNDNAHTSLALCGTDATTATATYNLASSGQILCSLIFKTGL